MKRGIQYKTLLFGLCWVLLAGLTSVLVTRWMLGQSQHHRHEHRHGPYEGSEQAFHDWMHQHLQLSPAQAQLLEPFELKFENERRRLRLEIQAIGHELALAVSLGTAMTPESEALLRRLNDAQAKLQRAALQHFFEMKEHLDTEQQAKLSQWTHDSLLHQEEAHE
jgi:nickel and cobalt resistance protein CnrR